MEIQIPFVGKKPHVVAIQSGLRELCIPACQAEAYDDLHKGEYSNWLIDVNFPLQQQYIFVSNNLSDNMLLQ